MNGSQENLQHTETFRLGKTKNKQLLMKTQKTELLLSFFNILT